MESDIIVKINNKICCYNSQNGNIIITDDNDLIMEKYNFGNINILGILGNSNTILYYTCDRVCDFNGKTIIKLENVTIYDITMDDENIYILENDYYIFKYHTDGTYIKTWTIKSHKVYDTSSKIILDKGKIYYWERANKKNRR